MEKSLAAEAELPYFPRMPIPTFATWIIPTSLPPSPIARVMPPSFYFTNLTIEAFYLGELRQKMTEETHRNISVVFGKEFDMIKLMAIPYIIMLI
jgi:hypothetical protein